MTDRLRIVCWLGWHDWKYHVQLTEVHAPPACREYIPFRTCRACRAQQYTCSLHDDANYQWQDIMPRYRKPITQWWEGDRQS